LPNSPSNLALDPILMDLQMAQSQRPQTTAGSVDQKSRSLISPTVKRARDSKAGSKEMNNNTRPAVEALNQVRTGGLNSQNSHRATPATPHSHHSGPPNFQPAKMQLESRVSSSSVDSGGDVPLTPTTTVSVANGHSTEPSSSSTIGSTDHHTDHAKKRKGGLDTERDFKDTKPKRRRKARLPDIDEKYRRFIRVKTHPNGGASTLSTDWRKLKAHLSADELSEFARQFITLGLYGEHAHLDTRETENNVRITFRV
jgi:hypothetical protein